jgi:hypothetical protein
LPPAAPAGGRAAPAAPHAWAGEGAARGEAQAVLQRLQALLADDDAEAVEWFRTHRALVEAALGAERLAALEPPLLGFAFPQALAALRDAMQPGPEAVAAK